MPSLPALPEINIQEPLVNFVSGLWSRIDPRAQFCPPNSANLQSNSPFLVLPRELRDFIIEFVVFTPNLPLSGEEDRRQRIKDIKLDAWNDGAHIFYPIVQNAAHPATHIAALALQSTCRQLYAEVQDALQREKTARTYALHVDIDDRGWGSYTVCPTWTRVPATTRRVDEVRTTVCVRSGPGPKPRSLRGDDTPPGRKPVGPRSAFTHGNGGPPPIIWSFYGTLERFLRVGPFYASPALADLPPEAAKALDRGLSIRTLVVDFVRPHPDAMPPNTEMLPEDHSFEGYAAHPPANADAYSTIYDATQLHYIPTPLAAASTLKDGIDTILAGYYTEFGKILYSRMDDVVVCVEGEERWRWDVAAKLENLRPAYPRSTWKDGVWAIRRERGLRTENVSSSRAEGKVPS